MSAKRTEGAPHFVLEWRSKKSVRQSASSTTVPPLFVQDCADSR